MASCNECLHKEACNHWLQKDNKHLGAVEGFICEHFKDRSKFVELPCKVGNDVWIVMRYNGKSLGIVQDKVQLIGFTSRGVHIKTRCHHDHNKMYMLGKTVFLTPEAAEKALEVHT